MRNKNLSRSIGKKIRAWRLMRGMTQAELARRIGRTPQRVCAMEIGRQDFTISMLVKLCRNLYVGLAELVDRPELF